METVNVRNVRIGDVLKEYGYVNDLQLQQALDYQKANKGKRLGNVLIEIGFITEKQMLSALAERLNLRITPELTFIRDEGVKHGAEISALLKQIEPELAAADEAEKNGEQDDE